MYDIRNVRVRVNKWDMYPIRIEMDGVMQIDLRIEQAAILVSFLADADYCDVTIDSRDWQWYHAAWKVELVGAVVYVSSPWHIGHAALSEQLATLLAAKLERAIDAVNLNEISKTAPSDSQSADPLVAAKLRMDNNLRSVFG